ncbi:MAG TPA: helix-turn-helix transcriptional regulator [Solibacillus sp.]
MLRFNLQKLLDEKGMSGNALARAINERPATLHDLIENRDMENRRVPARLIEKLCVFFEITPNELMYIERDIEDTEK